MVAILIPGIRDTLVTGHGVSMAICRRHVAMIPTRHGVPQALHKKQAVLPTRMFTILRALHTGLCTILYTECGHKFLLRHHPRPPPGEVLAQSFSLNLKPGFRVGSEVQIDVHAEVGAVKTGQGVDAAHLALVDFSVHALERINSQVDRFCGAIEREFADDFDRNVAIERNGRPAIDDGGIFMMVDKIDA